MWIADRIAWLVNEQRVRPEDILVLFEQSCDFTDLEQLVRATVPSIQGFVKPFSS